MELNSLNDQTKLNELIVNYTAADETTDNIAAGFLDIDSKLEHVVEYYELYQRFENEFQERQQNAPDFKVALSLWIDEIESRINREVFSAQSGFMESWGVLFSTAFDITTKGKTKRLRDFTDELLDINQIYDGETIIHSYALRKSSLWDMAEGVLYAHKLPFLKRELLQIEQIEYEPNKTNTGVKKLNWIGGPAEFGFIIDQLIAGGYLERPTANYTTDAVFYLNLFNIETTIGTLTKELSETTNNLSVGNRNKFKIPSKDKLD
jgi:hypothetical protein